MDPETGRYTVRGLTFCRFAGNDKRKVYVDANSNLAHQGGKIYRGDFGGSLLRDVRYAVTAPAGMRYVMNGLENLRPNRPGPV